jgi:hypothetical protein
MAEERIEKEESESVGGQVEPISEYDRGWTLGYRIGRGQMENYYKGQLETLEKQMRYYKDLSDR